MFVDFKIGEGKGDERLKSEKKKKKKEARGLPSTRQSIAMRATFLGALFCFKSVFSLLVFYPQLRLCFESERVMYINYEKKMEG